MFRDICIILLTRLVEADQLTIIHTHTHTHTCNRQLRGEDLQELSLDQLEQLEKSIEEGLVRVSGAKVWSNPYSLTKSDPLSSKISH